MQDLKCLKCGELNETFQRGQFITGTRCIACGYETLAKVCKSAEELKTFLDKVPAVTAVLFQDNSASVKMEVHYTTDMSRAEKVIIWRGSDK